MNDRAWDYQQLTALSNKVGDSIPKAIDKRNDREIQSLDRTQGKMFDRQF